MERGRESHHAGVRGAVAGAVAAACWAAAEPGLGRVFGTPYSDVRLLGRGLTRGRRWRTAGTVLHLANGAAFGWAFARLGGRGIRHGMLAAQAENAALWPLMLVVDRAHPDRRAGTWPRLATSPRVAGYAIAAHALFGAVLGALAGRSGRHGTGS